MKLFELTKKHNINFHNFKLELEKLGYVGYKGPNKVILDCDLESLEKIAEGFVEIQAKLDIEKSEKKKGRFMGIAFDVESQMFKVLVLKSSYRDLIEKGVEFEEVEEKNTIFKALIVIGKYVSKYINAQTIKKFGNMEE